MSLLHQPRRGFCLFNYKLNSSTMKLILFVMSVVISGLSSCFPVPVPLHRAGNVRVYHTPRVYAARPHYNKTHAHRHYNSRSSGRPRGWR